MDNIQNCDSYIDSPFEYSTQHHFITTSHAEFEMVGSTYG
jgi:hypothetical protein